MAELGLTARESDVLALLADGLPNAAIAARLYLSPRTVEKHVERIMAKTSTTRRAQLAVLASGLAATRSGIDTAPRRPGGVAGG